MRKFLTVLSLTVVTNVFALEFSGGYKADSSSNDLQYTESQLEKLYASEQPVCIKDGGKVLDANQAFRKRNLGYADCSSGKGAKARHEVMGINVRVVKIQQMPLKLRTQLYKQLKIIK